MFAIGQFARLIRSDVRVRIVTRSQPGGPLVYGVLLPSGTCLTVSERELTVLTA